MKAATFKEHQWLRLGDYTSKIGSGFTPLGGHTVYQKSGTPLIRSQNVHMNRFESDGLAFISAEQSDLMESSRVAPGDVLLNITGASIGRVCVVPRDYCPATVNQHVCIIRCGEDLEPHFLAFYLSSPDFQNFILRSQAGATRQALTKTMIEEFRIPKLEMPEQRGIADQLKMQLQELEDVLTAIRSQLDLADALPAAHLRSAFDSSDSRRWTSRRLGDLLELRKHVIHPRNNPKGRTVFVGLEHVESHTGRRTGSLDVEMGELTGRKPQFRQGDIVYGYLRPYLNKVWVAEFDGLCSVDQYVYSVKPEMADSNFIAWFMRSPTYLKRAPVGFTPGQLPRIRLEEVAKVEVELPPLPEQRAIAARLEAEFAASAALKSALKDQLKLVEGMTGALLRAAFSPH